MVSAYSKERRGRHYEKTGSRQLKVGGSLKGEDKKHMGEESDRGSKEIRVGGELG